MFFEDDELIKIFDSLLKVVIFLKEKRVIHGDLRPTYISRNPEKNCYVLTDRMIDCRKAYKI